MVEEIRSGGGTAHAFHFDVLNLDGDICSGLKVRWEPTHLYYFATPFIFSAIKGVFSAVRFREFCDYYVARFLNVVDSLRRRGLRTVFYPSSVAIDEIPTNMGEYAAAKMAGEMLCVFLEKTYPQMVVHRPRLPRIATDQTATLFSVGNEEAATVLLEGTCEG